MAEFITASLKVILLLLDILYFDYFMSLKIYFTKNL